MKHNRNLTRCLTFALACAMLSLGLAAAAAAQTPATDWADVYNPLVVRHLTVRLSQDDWNIIHADETFSIEKPAEFWADGEGPFNILIRRKSATPINEKISYKIDFGGTRWKDIKNLSLENGDDNNVVTEGLAWYFHRRATNDSYHPSLAAWAGMTVEVVRPVLDPDGNPVLDENGLPVTWIDVRPQGLYLNVEQVDKRFLIHRGLYTATTTYLYKQDDIGLPEIKESPTGLDSPAYGALDFSPFSATRLQGKKVLNPTPTDPNLELRLNEWINMDSMLRLGAVNAYSDNPDELFNKGKNYFWADYTTDTLDKRRAYFPWDLDAAIRNTKAGIYATVTTSGKKTTVSQHPYQEKILNHPVFRARYNAIMSELINGPMSVAELQMFLYQTEAVISAELLADPNNKIGSTPEAVASYFSYLRSWVALRDASVRSQIQKNGPPSPRPAY